MNRIIGSPFTLIRKLGWREGTAQWLRHFLPRKRTLFHYPGSSREFTVNFDDEWKYIERDSWSESGCITYLRNEVVKPNQVIIDVGANVGQYSLFFSELVGDGGEVVAFEPDPINIGTLHSNLERNKVANVVAEQVCVSDNRGSVLLSGRSFGGTESSIVRYRGQQASKSIKVDAVTLDDYCREHNLSPDGIKIDVEGAELLVFKGMRQLIATRKPWILLELHGEFSGDESVKDIWENVGSQARHAIFMGGDNLGYKLGEIVRWKLPPSRAHIRILLLF